MLTQAVQSSIIESKDEDEEASEESESESELDVKSDGSEADNGMEDVGFSIEDLATMAVSAFDHLTESSKEIDMPN